MTTVSDLEKRGKYLAHRFSMPEPKVSYKIVETKFDESNMPMLGEFYFLTSELEISEDVVNADEMVLDFVLWHELSHYYDGVNFSPYDSISDRHGPTFDSINDRLDKKWMRAFKTKRLMRKLKCRLN